MGRFPSLDASEGYEMLYYDVNIILLDAFWRSVEFITPDASRLELFRVISGLGKMKVAWKKIPVVTRDKFVDMVLINKVYM